MKEFLATIDNTVLSILLLDDCTVLALQLHQVQIHNTGMHALAMCHPVMSQHPVNDTMANKITSGSGRFAVSEPNGGFFLLLLGLLPYPLLPQSVCYSYGSEGSHQVHSGCGFH